RFLTAYFAACPGMEVTLDGSERMRQRPIGPLVEALRLLGADITYKETEGFPPLAIKGRRLKGGTVEIDSTVSSQFVSALLLVAPTMTDGLTIRLLGEPASLPYILMTLSMMDEAGAETDFYGGDTIEVKPVAYSRPTIPVEGDWSAAAFAYQIESLAMGEMTVEGITEDSCQGDAAARRLWADLGVDTSWETEGEALLNPSPECSPRVVEDMGGTPDLVQPLVVTLVTLGIPFRLTGLETLSIKETDRMEALKTEMLKLGAVIENPTPGVAEWDGRRRPITELPVFETYDDHRMAMSLAPVAVTVPGIVVKDIEVVAKSFPGYWEQLEAMGFMLVDASLPMDQVRQLLGIEEEE
ncbi:MAG: 3-phosphoshikimate 1-carboxyvinyltransferase, partial [Muribaculaceae bacterium]|nr:3-phosphoshikimate 1-carboxyvinyltransferase [Muribaculaceae bacterium]